MIDRELLDLAAKAAGIVNKPRVDGEPLLNPIGEKYGMLTVIQEVSRKSPRKRRFLCICDCGAQKEVELNKLRTGHTRSCGCLHIEARARNLEKAPSEGRKKHGLNKSPEHRAWVHMKQRCTNPNKKEWPHYGGRGIKVCERWMNSFEAFIEAVGKRPSPKHSLDRINVNGDYEPGNVRWATQQEQCENTRVTRIVTINDKSQSISAWEREMELSKGQVRAREDAGWSLKEAILTPSIKGQKRHMKVKRDYSEYPRDERGRYTTRRAIVRAAAEIGGGMQ